MSTPSGATVRPLEPLQEAFRSVMCVVAHPDDIEYGLAAAVHRWVAQGKTVTYLLASRGEAGIDTMHPREAGEVREAEERAGAAVVGVDVVDVLGFPDGVIEYGLPLRRALCRVIRQRRPECVVAMSHEVRLAGRLGQSDHRAVGLATLDAVRDAANRWVFTDLGADGVEPWSGVTTLLVGWSSTPTHFVDVGGHVEPAVASLEAHRAYNAALPQAFPRPRELVTMILGLPASVTGVPYSVTFERLQV